MQLSCPLCGAALKANDVNINTGLGSCSSCNKAFSIAGHIQFQKPRVTQSKTFVEVTSSEGSVLVYPWKHNPLKWFFLLFSIIWNSIVILSLAAFITTFDEEIFQFHPAMLLFLIHPTVGIGMAYATLCFFLNQTKVYLIWNLIKVTHGPLPSFRRTHNIDPRLVAQFYVERYTAYTKNRVPQHSFAVKYITKDGDHAPLVRGIKSYEDALYVEQKLEARYSLADEQVDKEFRP